jgi:hypothetical protein
MFMADLHMHTNQSDGKLPLSELIDIYGGLGFGAIAVTDHLCESQSVLGKAARYLGCSLTEANFDRYLSDLATESERAWDQYGMLVIPGIEITKNSISNHRSAHVLALGVRQWIDPCLDIPELCDAIRGAGGLAIAAHPVSTRRWEKQTYHLWDRRAELINKFDAWEVASGAQLFPEVLQSKLPKIANSDLHHRGQMSSWKTVFSCEKKEEALLDAIREQDLRFEFFRDPADNKGRVLDSVRDWAEPSPFPLSF